MQLKNYPIIDDQQRLHFRLEELKSIFIKSSYPPVLVNEILDYILTLPRNLEYSTSTDKDAAMTPCIFSYGPGFVDAQQKAFEVNDL